jgi:hypothetical protein
MEIYASMLFEPKVKIKINKKVIILEGIHEDSLQFPPCFVPYFPLFCNSYNSLTFFKALAERFSREVIKFHRGLKAFGDERRRKCFGRASIMIPVFRGLFCREKRLRFFEFFFQTFMKVFKDDLR